ncbi:MAG TPA: PAS domain S-box protein, partial [Candidatus Dormibacteraeota bacterium]|nr:PAS domain S-box protein [Candidatus Dormibacteraeota bacterium]
LDPMLGTRFPFATLFAAVLVSAWFGGFGPGLAASLMGAEAATWFLLDPRHRVWADDAEGQAGLVLYLAVSLGIAAIGGAMRRARRRAEAEATIAASQRESLRVTLQSIGDAVITTDVRGCVTSMNAVAAALTGWTVEAAIGQPLDAVFRIIDESTRQPAPSPVEQALAQGTVVGLANHTLLIDRDGRERLIDDSAAPIRDAHGVVSGVVLVFRDVSDRRRIEHTQALLANVVELSDDAIVTKDLNGTVTSWNAGAERVFGYTREEMIGQPILRIVPGDRSQEETRILAAIRRGDRVDHFESERVHKDGRRINVSISVSPIRSPSGPIIGASKIARDITGQKRADLERQQRLHELTTLYAVGQAVAAELDRARVLQTITDAATDLSGARFGAFFYNVVAPDGGHYLLYTLSGAPREVFEGLGMPRNTSLFAPTFAGRSVVRVADIRRDPRYGHNAPHFGTPAGHLPVVSYLAVPVTSRGGEVLGGLFLGHPDAGVFTAEAERVVVALAAQAAIALENARLFEAAQQARAAAEQASQDKDHFLAMLGHELRNPLSAVRNALSASLLDPSQTARALAIASHAAEHLTRLVDDLLDVTRVTQGRLMLRPQPLDLGELVQRALDTVRPLCDERRVTVALSLPARPCTVVGDPLRLEQVVGNLLTNAAKYSDPGGHVAVAVEQADGTAVVRVSDAGIGIAPDLLPRVFDLFVQGEQALDRSRGGLGIGLTLVKKLVDLHRGRVEAHSEGLGRGAEFVVRLPADDGAPQPSPSLPAGPMHRAGARVLIVEDNADAAESLMMLLEVLGFDVRAAGDGTAALAAARADRPDVMLIDIGLPGMSGYDLAAQIRADPTLRGVVLVALTGYGQEEDRQRALAAGFDHHLVKPVEMDRVRALMSSLRPPSRQGVS